MKEMRLTITLMVRADLAEIYKRAGMTATDDLAELKTSLAHTLINEIDDVVAGRVLTHDAVVEDEDGPPADQKPAEGSDAYWTQGEADGRHLLSEAAPVTADELARIFGFYEQPYPCRGCGAPTILYGGKCDVCKRSKRTR